MNHNFVLNSKMSHTISSSFIFKTVKWVYSNLVRNRKKEKKLNTNFLVLLCVYSLCIYMSHREIFNLGNCRRDCVIISVSVKCNTHLSMCSIITCRWTYLHSHTPWQGRVSSLFLSPQKSWLQWEKKREISDPPPKMYNPSLNWVGTHFLLPNHIYHPRLRSCPSKLVTEWIWFFSLQFNLQAKVSFCHVQVWCKRI